ncbi:MAG: 3',5'-cyclic-nucleotide phosphodiesterase [Silvibacterium sp.]|nr:3',5'-cyclic-nucleotide phosphodiesterase [Silvibacterium sp.]MBV8436132.1 3',5'-cyclic-nucleotide phosphodiesterase [Silvibacterium sp.]
MKVRLLGSSVHDTARRQYVTSYLINGVVGIDAGSTGFHGTPQEQEAVEHVFLTHSHIDHTASLPIFVENAWTPTEGCPTIYGSPQTLDAVQKHIFNDVIWPDFVALSRNMPPFLRLHPIDPEMPLEAAGLRFTPILVHHVVPTFGYVVSDGHSSVIFGADSGPTHRIWEVAHQTPNLRAVFLEACFPNSLSGLAKASLHLTTDMFAREVAKIPPGVRIVAIHIKVRYREQVIRELKALGLPNLEIGECEKDYEF